MTSSSWSPVTLPLLGLLLPLPSIATGLKGPLGLLLLLLFDTAFLPIFADAGENGAAAAVSLLRMMLLPVLLLRLAGGAAADPATPAAVFACTSILWVVRRFPGSSVAASLGSTEEV